MEFILSSARAVELEEHVALLRDVCEDVGVVPPEAAAPTVADAVRKHLERRAIAFSVVKPDMIAFENSSSGAQFGSIRAYVDAWLLEIATLADGASGSFNVLDPSCELDVATLFSRYPNTSAMGAKMKADHFFLLPQQIFLNCASYGATPKVVLDARVEWEACEIMSPWSFRVSTVPLRLRQVQNRLAEFVGAHPSDLQLLVNANAATSAILKSMPWEVGDVLLLFSVDYDATKKAAKWLEAMYGVVTDYIDVVLPMNDDDVVRALQTHLQVRRTQKVAMPKLFNFCHCTSRTGWIFPAARLTAVAHEYGVPVMIDGAQAPGHFPVDVTGISAEYYIGTCHKWMFTCPGVGFLVVAPSKQRVVRPLAPTVTHDEPFSRSFALSAPDDVSPFLSVLQSFEFVERVLGGWRSVFEYNANLSRQVVRELTRLWNLDAERSECLQLHQIHNGGRPGLDPINCMPLLPVPGWRNATEGADKTLMGHLLTRKGITALCVMERLRCPDDTVMTVLCVRITCQIHVSIEDVRKFGRAIAELQGAQIDLEGNTSAMLELTAEQRQQAALDAESDPVALGYTAS